jgi:phospholipid:diacylglycerol acyltransferase
MMIKGGSTIWGNETWAPDDDENADDTHGTIYAFKMPPLTDQLAAADSGPASEEQQEASPHDANAYQDAPRNLTANDALTWLLQHTPTSFQQVRRPELCRVRAWLTTRAR